MGKITVVLIEAENVMGRGLYGAAALFLWPFRGGVRPNTKPIHHIQIETSPLLSSVSHCPSRNVILPQGALIVGILLENETIGNVSAENKIFPGFQWAKNIRLLNKSRRLGRIRFFMDEYDNVSSIFRVIIPD